ncbi:P27 family phage terminase small subunit [Mesorhizobium sp. dw_380]|uniref:P27 family phage terminase small subunit n=1 Tax=Mesorhizobium sp. dw_380 TaxID=2812001 RepID=UPI003324A607
MGARGPVSAASLNVVPIANQSGGKSVRVPKVPAPAHLSAASKKWWAEVNAEYSLEAHHLRLLQMACESWERTQAARAAIARFGLTFTDSQGNPKARPEIAIERDSKIGFARLVRELDLDGEPAPESRRPPAIRSNRD